ncbi:MAG: hypothetical protein JNL70_11785 [Saprospiraceae bacterium]|nr:hypothetical protein [Saprospiraceae bacterium]
MSRHLPFNREEFNYLFQKIEQKFRKLKEDDKKSEYFGHGKGYEPYPIIKDKDFKEGQGKASLKYAMLQDSEVKKYLAKYQDKSLENLTEGDIESFGKTFYGVNLEKKYKDIKKDELVGIQEVHYGNIYLLYAGVCSFEESLKIDIYAKFIADFRTSKEDKDSVGKDMGKVIDYKSYYYSYFEHKIKDFDIKIDYNLDEEGKYYAEEQYFHNNEAHPLYKGYAYVAEQKLQIVVRNRDNEADKLNITLDSGKEPWRKDIMIGSLSGISAQQNSPLLSMEIVVVPVSKGYDNVHLDIIKRYLFLNRKSFIVREPPFNITTLTYRGENIRDLSYLVGNYRLWRFDEKYSSIVESHFQLDNQFNAICKTKQYETDSFDNQICLLRFNNNKKAGTTVFITTYSNEDAGMLATSLISNIILKPFQLYGNEEHRIAKGALIVHGRETDGLLKRAIIFQRVDDPAEIEVGCHPIADILKRVEEEKGKRGLKKALDLLIDTELRDVRDILDSYVSIKKELDTDNWIKILDRKGFTHLLKQLADLFDKKIK